MPCHNAPHTHIQLFLAGIPPITIHTHIDAALAKWQNVRMARLKGNKLTPPFALSNKKALRRHCMHIAAGCGGHRMEMETVRVPRETTLPSLP